MAIGKGKIGAELTMLALIVASLGGTLHLVVSIHRRALEASQPPEVPKPATPPLVADAPAPTPPPRAKKSRPAATPAQPRQEDPTPRELARLAEATARELAEAERLDRESATLDQAKRVAAAESEKWRRREMLVKQQVAALSLRAQKADQDVDAYASQRDVLARERDALKAAIANAPGEGSYAVLPYQGVNGTWRRPIVIECTAGQVAIRPNGPTFSLLDLSGLINPRSSPVVVAIAKELLKVQMSKSPDGSPVVPYFVFLVRPDGIRSYYEARARLEPLGIAFGYELIERDLPIHIPNFDDLATWDGTPSIGVPRSQLAGTEAAKGDGAIGGGGAPPGAGGGLSWPAAGSNPEALAGAFGSGKGRGGSSPKEEEGSGPDDFTWPVPRPGLGGNGGPIVPGGHAGEDSVVGTSGAPGAEQAARKPLNPARGVGGGLNGDRDVLGSLVERLPDFDRPGLGASRSAQPGSAEARSRVQGLGSDPVIDAGRASQGTAGSGPSGVPGSRGFEGEQPPTSAGTIPGRSWQSDGRGKPSSGSPSTLPEREGSRRGLEPMTADRGPGAKSEGLLWGGDSSAAGPASNGTNPGQNGVDSPGGVGRTAIREGAVVPPGSMGGSPPRSGSLPPNPKLASSELLRNLASTGGSAPPGLMLGGDAEPKSGSSSGPRAPADPEMKPLIPDREKPPVPAIEVPFEIVVACGADGVTIQPGAYRITGHALRDRKDGELLIRHLEAVARKRAEVDPAIRPKPRVKFLVESNGSDNFWEARRQVLFSGLDWPMTLQVAGSQNPRLLDRGMLR